MINSLHTTTEVFIKSYEKTFTLQSHGALIIKSIKSYINVITHSPNSQTELEATSLFHHFTSQAKIQAALVKPDKLV